MNPTPFGIEIRKLRLEQNVTMSEMAAYLNLSPSFLSLIETGKRRIKSDILEAIIRFFKLDDERAASLKSKVACSQPDVRVPLSGSEADRELLLALAQNFAKLSDEDKERLRLILLAQ